MALVDWRGVGRRIGQLAGIFTLLLAIVRLGRLLDAGPSESRWQLILVVSAFLGGVAWWLLDQVLRNTPVKVGVLAVGAILVAMRVSVSETLAYGVLPTDSTFAALGNQLETAGYVIQFGVPPVAPLPGIIAILSVVMWSVGALFNWGSTRGPHAAMFLPSLVMYFQFAVFDRDPAGLGWLGSSVIAVGLAVLSVAMERKEEAGRARDTEGRPVARRTVGVAVTTVVLLAVGSLALANTASTVFSEYGNKWWSSRGGGFGAGGAGGVRFDGLVDLRQKVISRSDTPVFQATVNGDHPPLNEIYWRMESFDVFNGVEWRRSNSETSPYRPGQTVANSRAYWGTTYDFLQQVHIDALRSSIAPTAGMATEIHDPSGSPVTPRRPNEFEVLADASIVTVSPLGEGDTYQLRSVMPDRRADLGVLATGADGQLTDLFANAAAAGEFDHGPATLDVVAEPPSDLGRYVELPTDVPNALGALAARQVRGSSSDYERAWLLQAWFRETGGFIYSDQVSTGHSALDLTNWLTDPNSENYRIGYCEQFAAAMGVLLRELGVPSRVVWGFTPGEATTQTNAETGQEITIITVKDTNAHAWVEAWIDPLGWVQFDPTPRSDQTDFAFQPESLTAGFDPQDYVEEVPLSTPGVPNVDAGEGFVEDPELLPGDPASSATGPRWWLIFMVGLVPIAGLIPLYKRIRRRRRVRRVREGDITAAWDEIVDRLADLGEPIPESKTPIEFARERDSALLPIALSYSSTVYGGRTGQAKESDLIAVEWWLSRRYDGRTRMKAALSPRSLRRDGRLQD